MSVYDPMSGRRLERQFAAYEQSHQHPINIAIHKFAIPVIVFSVLIFASAVALPVVGSLAWPLMAAAVAYTLRLSPRLALGVALVLSAMAGSVVALRTAYASQLNVAGAVIFVLAWLAQFVGHMIEGRRPKFLEDLSYLLVGPLWTLSSAYAKLGIKT